MSVPRRLSGPHPIEPPLRAFMGAVTKAAKDSGLRFLVIAAVLTPEGFRVGVLGPERTTPHELTSMVRQVSAAAIAECEENELH